LANAAVRTIGRRELKAQTSAVVREIQSMGAEFIVTVRGRPVARIEPIVADQRSSPDGMGGLRGALFGAAAASLGGFRPQIPVMHDRLIAAVGLLHDAVVLTRDPDIQAHPLVRSAW
jgi:antitoxin (DNA-binding transcriptional repressor) of toxin-antitoxin stability system